MALPPQNRAVQQTIRQQTINQNSQYGNRSQQYTRPPQQRITPPKELAEVEFETMTGHVKLTPEIIRSYLVSGDDDAANKVSDQEVMMFLTLCKYRQLNPFLREAYLIKFGNSPASIVVSKDLFTKRAAASQKCDGWQAGVIVLAADNQLIEREGTLVIKEIGEKLVGGWASVIRNDWKHPMIVQVSLDEYVRHKKSGEVFENWRKMPATMIRKVALVQALREGLPEEFGGMYVAEELDVDQDAVKTAPYINTDAQPVDEHPPMIPAETGQNAEDPAMDPAGDNGDKPTERSRMDEATLQLLEDFYNKITDYAATKEHNEAMFKTAAENIVCEYMRIDNISQASSALLKGVMRSITTVITKAEDLYQQWLDQPAEDAQ
jgi:phage recombination protein Bet